MPAAALVIGVLAVETGVALAIGSAIAGGVGLSVAGAGVAASLAASTVSVAVATAIGSGVVSAGLSIAQGAKVSDALKGAVIGGVASFVGASVAGEVTKSITTAAANAGATTIAGSIGKIAGAMAGGGVQGAVGSVLSGKGDPIKALITGGLTAGLTSGAMIGVNEVTSRIPGFSDLGKNYGAAGAATQRAVNAGLAAGVLGKDTDAAVVNSVLKSMLTTGADYIKTGIKDGSAALQTAYNNATKTGEDLESNITRQNEIVKDYTSTAEDVESKRLAIQTNLDAYNENKDGYDNYDAKMQRDGYARSEDESGNVSYYKMTGGRYEMLDDGEGGQYRAFVADGTYKDDEGNPRGQTVYAPTKDSFLQEANKYAKLVNDAIPGYEEERTAVETKLANLSGELDTLKTQVPTLQQTLIEQKTALDTSVADFQKQEEENAQLVAKAFNDTVAAKTSVEQALGAPLTQEQLDAFVQTGDVKTAAQDYIDIKTTDLAEAQAAALKEGYRFDPNDPDMVARFTGVKDEAETLAAIQSFADARATTVQEATDLYRQTYADIYGPDVDVPDPTQEDLLAFMPQIPVDVSSIPEGYQSVAEDVVKGRIQDTFSQDLGFDDYLDRTEAQSALGEERPDAATWQEYAGTSGIVDSGNEDIFQTSVKAGDDVAATRSLTPAYDTAATDTGTDTGTDTFGFDQTNQFDPTEFGLAPSNQFNAEDYGPFQPEQTATSDFGTIGQDTQQAQTAGDDQFGFETVGDADLFGQPTASDFGVAAGPTTGQTTEDTGMADIGLGTTTEGTQPDYGMASQFDTMLTNPEFDQQVADFDAPSYMGTQPSQDIGDIGVQTAANAPLTTMTDTGAPTDVGLRSLVSQQGGGTSATADDTQETPTTLTGQNLADTESQQDQTQADDTKIADSTLTTGAPAGTITEKVLGENADQDVPADSLTSKYFNEPKEESEDADSLSAKSLTEGFNYGSPRPTDEIVQGSSIANLDRDNLDSFLSPLRTNTTSLTTGRDTPLTNAATQGNAMEEDNFDWDSWDRAVEDYVNQYDASRASQSDSDPDANGSVGSDSSEDGVLRTPSGVDESFLDRLSPEERERYLAMQDPNYVNPLEGLAPQDLGISQQNIDSFNENFNPAGGFSSGWQTVGTNRVFINDDGTASVLDPTTGGSSYLTKEQVDALVANGTLNSAKSGYVAATGGTGNKPGGSGGGGGGGTTKTTGTGGKSTTDKIIDKIVDGATSKRGLATIAGAVLGPKIAPKGINPMGLRSLQEGGGKQMVQTGAKGTGGKGGVRYFEKKAGGGEIKGGLGYLKSAHDGMADKINATIDNKRPAKLSGGEFVIPADVVSHLGNGNSEAGAKQLYELMSRIRKERTGTPKQAKQVNPKKYLPR